MSAKKSFITLLRIVFLLSSLLFIRDAFFKWDGYSYYMRFKDFLPDVSLVFVIHSLLWALTAFLLWLFFSVIVKIASKLKYEYLITWFILGVFILTMKQIFFKDISLTQLTGLGYEANLIIIGLLLTAIVWAIHKYTEKILSEIDNRITPVVWLFAFLLILSLPLSIFKKGFSEAESDHVSQIGTEKQIVKSSEEKPPNIILVIMDALTALDMQLYGYYRPTTPFISEWAKDAILFKRAYSSSNWTSSAMISMMTGQRPWTHRIWHYVYYSPIDNYKNNLPRLLKDYGYNLYSFVQNPYAHPDALGIGDAFLVKDPSHSFFITQGLHDNISNFFANRPIVAEWILQIKPFSRLVEYFTPVKYSTPKPSEKVYNRFLEFISENKTSAQRPFFAWLHLWPPHELYLPPKPFMGLFGDAERFNTSFEQSKRDIKGEYKLERQNDVDILRKRYDEFILYSDKQFETFWLNLTKNIDMSNTIVILTSDHGESFSHGYQEHGGPHLYEELVHVPLIIKLPNNAKGKIINMAVEQIDIAPTILELVGIFVPEWMEGRSLIPLIKGEYFEEKPVFSFSMDIMKNRFGHPIKKGTIAVWDGDYKLIYYLEDNKVLLFNLRSDPNETLNIADKNKDISQKLLETIKNNLEARTVDTEGKQHTCKDC